MRNRVYLLVILSVLLHSAGLHAITPNLQSNIDRPLRYTPDNGDFLIVNGAEWFNRPLYGGHTAFRVDAGDKPEFSLYVPGRGGNLRLGIKALGQTEWLSDCQQIITRYRPGEMLYEIRDPAFGNATVRVAALAMNTTEGLLLRVQIDGVTDATELFWAFGGANGNRGSRSGDIGAEREPVSQFFQLKPEYCRGNKFDISGNIFVLNARPSPARIAGIFPTASHLAIGNSQKWQSPTELLSSTDKPADQPVIVGSVSIKSGQPVYLALQRLAGGGATEPDTLEAPKVSDLQESPQSSTALAPQYRLDDLPRLFDQTEDYFRQLSHKLAVDTPDPFINSAVPALCVAADGVWDDSAHAFMHGAVAWRTKLLGWRGSYAGDALGWHERTQEHLDNWFSKQNTQPIDNKQTGPDLDTDLTRCAAMLHTNGDLSKSHYDMNLVAIDSLFRHLLWTGDRDYMKKVWPVIQRHLAWEKRLFRREFGPDHLPLYEAYCCIWASDDLQYGGGGAAHSSAYNYFHNRMAARIAEILGEDPAPYKPEADLILKGMQKYLWLQDRGWFGEFKDFLGNQLVHPSAALWTNYTTIDSRVADPFQGWQMGQYVNTQIAHIPVRGKGVPDGYFQMPTTDWMPYTWSINNVVMAETVHTSLSQWEAGQRDDAFAEFKGAILDSMFLGLCPGNVGMCTYYDDYRRESQRDFADACGITSRAVVEGLFGVTPDALAGELTIRPGFPAQWDHASIRHVDFNYSYKRDGAVDTFSIESRFPRPMTLRLDCIARAVSIASITVNGQPAEWKNVDDAISVPRIVVTAAPAERWDVQIRWEGDSPAKATVSKIAALGHKLDASVAPATLVEISDPQRALDQIQTKSDSLSATACGSFGHRTAFAHVKQGNLSWWLPLQFEIRPPIEIVDDAGTNEKRIQFHVRNNTAEEVSAEAMLDGSAQSPVVKISASALADSAPSNIETRGLLPGTNEVQLQTKDGGHFQGIVTNWKIKADPSVKWDAIDLSSAFNDKVTRIFKNDYLSPRSPYCSLSIAKDGIGGWCTYATTAEIDDTGLRNAAAAHVDRFTLPQGIPFKTPGAASAENITFTSQWDNYPKEITIPLSGPSSHAYLLMAGSTNAMQSRFDNGEVIFTYANGTTQRLALENPTNWWPIEKDYFIDDYAFARSGPIPPRVNLKTGTVRFPQASISKGPKEDIPGGSAIVLDLPLDSGQPLRSVTVRTISNEVVIGLMAVTLVR